MPIEAAPSSPAGPETGVGPLVVNESLYTRIKRRLIPYMFLLYIVAYLDRVNVGFAAMDMQRQLGFSNTVYGTGASIFFIGYALFDLPSSLLLRKFGTRMWIARIMISWGFVCALMVGIHSAHMFYVLRLLLGIAEAGFVPGMLLYLTFWFPSHERARAVAWFFTSTSLAGVVGAPLSSVILKLNGTYGLAGWQWLFLLEGVPTMLLGISVLFVLDNGPSEAKWLSADEKAWLARDLEADQKRYGATGHGRLVDAWKMPELWLLAGLYVVIQIGVYIVNLWMPLILASIHSGKGSGAADASLIARYSTVPYLLAAICTVIIGKSSDRWNERRRHLAGCMLLCAAGFCWAARAGSIATALVAMSFAAIGLWSTMGPFWALTTRMVRGAAAAGAVATITMLGGFGGFLGPYLTGILRDLTRSFAGGLYGVGALAVVAAGLALAAPKGAVSESVSD